MGISRFISTTTPLTMNFLFFIFCTMALSMDLKATSEFNDCRLKNLTMSFARPFGHKSKEAKIDLGCEAFYYDETKNNSVTVPRMSDFVCFQNTFYLRSNLKKELGDLHCDNKFGDIENVSTKIFIIVAFCGFVIVPILFILHRKCCPDNLCKRKKKFDKKQIKFATNNTNTTNTANRNDLYPQNLPPSYNEVMNRPYNYGIVVN